MRRDRLLLVAAVLACLVGARYSVGIPFATDQCATDNCETVVGWTWLLAMGSYVVLLGACGFVWTWWPQDRDRALRVRWLAVIVGAAVAVFVAMSIAVSLVSDLPIL